MASVCNYCQGEVEWLEVAAGQRVPFDLLPEPAFGRRPEQDAAGRRPYVFDPATKLVRLMTDEDRRLARDPRYRHRCLAYASARGRS